VLQRRFRRSVVLAAGIAGVLTAASFAFFVGSFLADGSHEGTAGSGGGGTNTLPVKVNFPSGQLTPEHAVPLTAEVENTTAKSVTFTHVTATVTDAEPSRCLPAWFHVKVEGGSKPAQWTEALEGKASAPVTLKYEPGTGSLFRSGEVAAKLELEETGTNQEACEGLPVKVTFHLN